VLFKRSKTESHALVRFEVEDTGIGISPTAQCRLFESFSQAVALLFWVVIWSSVISVAISAMLITHVAIDIVQNVNRSPGLNGSRIVKPNF